MHLSTTISREVTQTFKSATSGWGLGKEPREATSVLRVRTRLECPEGNLRELMWHSNPNHGIVRETPKKRPFPWKALMPQGDPRCAHRTKDCALANTKGEQASWHLGPSLPRGREADVLQPEPEGNGLVQSLPQWPHLPPSLSRLLIANRVFLPSWMAHVLQECHSLRTAPQKRYMAHLRLCPHGTPRKPGGRDWGRAWDARPTWECAHQAPGLLKARAWEGHKMHSPSASVPLWSTDNLSDWDLGIHKMRVHLGQCSCMEPEQLEPRKYTKPWAVANPVWSIHCKHFPHRPAVFVCSGPPSP